MPQQINPIDGLRDDIDALAKRLEAMQGSLDRLADQLPTRLAAAATSLDAIHQHLQSPKRWRGLTGSITWGVLLGSLATAVIAWVILNALSVARP